MGPTEFLAPHGLTVDSRGDLYVGEVSWTNWPQTWPLAREPSRNSSASQPHQQEPTKCNTSPLSPPRQARRRPPSPGYHHYLIERRYPSTRDNFEYVANLYRYLQWQQGGRRGRRWLLKNESLLGFLDDFLVVHPNATLMHIHRDPRVSIPSLLKLGTEFSRP